MGVDGQTRIRDGGELAHHDRLSITYKRFAWAQVRKTGAMVISIFAHSAAPDPTTRPSGLFLMGSTLFAIRRLSKWQLPESTTDLGIALSAVGVMRRTLLVLRRAGGA